MTLKRFFAQFKFRDLLHLLLVMLIFVPSIIAKIFLRNYWLISENRNEARDNGYWLYKYIKENKIQQKCHYAINKKAPDYKKIKQYKGIISFGSISHWFWYIVSDKNISSQKNGSPNAFVVYFFEIVLKFRKKSRVFLQHGITINDGAWLHYENTNYALFITGCSYENEYIKEKFNYPANHVKLTGFARFDGLHDIKVEDDLILIMPTWREEISFKQKQKSFDFTSTNYFKYWSSLLTNKDFENTLKENNKRVIFYLHRDFQQFSHFFKVDSSLITIADSKQYDVQDLLKRAKYLISDYSSVIFDFAYMRKAVFLYQFDEDEFRKSQYNPGFLDYKKCPLMEWSKNIEDLIGLIKNKLANPRYLLPLEVIKEYFPMYDKNNSQRIYEAIKG